MGIIRGLGERITELTSGDAINIMSIVGRYIKFRASRYVPVQAARSDGDNYPFELLSYQGTPRRKFCDRT